MMNSHIQKRKTSLAADFLGWIAAFLLVCTLTGMICGWTLLRITTDGSMHERIALRDALIDDQMEQLGQTADQLGESYGFDPMIIKDLLDRETVIQLNRQVIAWWTKMSTTGVPEEMPLWEGSAVRDRLMQDAAFQEKYDVLTRDTAGKVVSELNGTLSRMVFPMREILITEGLQVIRRRAALTEILNFLQGIPLALTLLSGALAGWIVLLGAKRRSSMRQQLGSALGGAGLLSLCVLILFRMMNLSGLIMESSVRLAGQVRILENVLTVEVGIVILLLLTGGWLLLRNAAEQGVRVRHEAD